MGMRSLLMFQNDQLFDWKPTGTTSDTAALKALLDVLLAGPHGEGNRTLGVSWVSTAHTSGVEFLEAGGFQAESLPYAERALIEKFREKLVRRAKKVWGAPPKGRKWRAIQVLQAGSHPCTGDILVNADGIYLCLLGKVGPAMAWVEMDGPQTTMNDDAPIVLTNPYQSSSYIRGQTYAGSSDVLRRLLIMRGYRVGIRPEQKP